MNESVVSSPLSVAEGARDGSEIIAVLPPVVEAVLPGRRRSVSKVARLPLKVREMVNRRFEDGALLKDIGAELKKSGFEVSESSLSRWGKTGFQDWVLRKERRVERREKAGDLAKEVRRMRGKSGFALMNHVVVAEQLNDVLERFDGEKLLAAAKKEPGMFFRLVRAVNSQLRNEVFTQHAELELKRYRALERAKKTTTSKQNQRGGITREELERIKRDMRI